MDLFTQLKSRTRRIRREGPVERESLRLVLNLCAGNRGSLKVEVGDNPKNECHRHPESLLSRATIQVAHYGCIRNRMELTSLEGNEAKPYFVGPCEAISTSHGCLHITESQSTSCLTFMPFSVRGVRE